MTPAPAFKILYDDQICIIFEMQRKTRRSMRFLLRHNKDLLETLHFLGSSDQFFLKIAQVLVANLEEFTSLRYICCVQRKERCVNSSKDPCVLIEAF